MATILCIDDEHSVLSAIQRVLSACGHKILIAQSGQEGLDILAEGPSVDMVICDMRMPGMDGYETLAEIRKRHPEIVRVVLSGYTTKESMLKTVLDGTANVYVQKPWRNQDIVGLVGHLLTIRAELSNAAMQSVFSKVDGLPALPQIYQKICLLISEGQPSAKIADIIEMEPAYAARILRVANSAIHGVSIGNVRQAVVYLGLNTVKNIVLACSVFAGIDVKSEGMYSVEQLWIHSNLCNLAASLLHTRIYGHSVPDELACAGLLHDIGKLMMIRFFPAECAQIAEQAGRFYGIDCCKLEKQILGATHAEIGAKLLDWWNLPPQIVEGCLYHHDPANERALDQEWLCLLNVADTISWNAQGLKRTDYNAAALARIGLTLDIDNDLELQNALKASFEELSSMATVH